MFNLSKTNEPHRTDERLVVPERWRDQRLALNVAGNGARLFAQYTERLGLPKAEVEQFLLAEQHAPRHAYLVNLTAQSLREMERKTICAFASHYLDDLVDGQDREMARTYLALSSPQDFHFHNVLGQSGTLLVEALVKDSLCPVEVERSLRQLIYGSALEHVQETLSFSKGQYRDWITEQWPQSAALHAREALSPALLMISNKAILGLFMANENGELAPFRCDLWSFCYAPLLYLSNIEQEIASGELQRNDMLEVVQLEGLLNFVEHYSEYMIDERTELRRLQLFESLAFFEDVLTKFPELNLCYDRILRSLRFSDSSLFKE
ncbi:MAG: hypothetical protein KDD62_04190 [Bdellovibrionales bacterium]|nr:hypothetical protein [Bdellovibrionales bacterium]